MGGKRRTFIYRIQTRNGLVENYQEIHLRLTNNAAPMSTLLSQKEKDPSPSLHTPREKQIVMKRVQEETSLKGQWKPSKKRGGCSIGKDKKKCDGVKGGLEGAKGRWTENPS